jgi:hypothetical protein
MMILMEHKTLNRTICPVIKFVQYENNLDTQALIKITNPGTYCR